MSGRKRLNRALRGWANSFQGGTVFAVIWYGGSGKPKRRKFGSNAKIDYPYLHRSYSAGGFERCACAVCWRGGFSSRTTRDCGGCPSSFICCPRRSSEEPAGRRKSQRRPHNANDKSIECRGRQFSRDSSGEGPLGRFSD